MFTIRVANNQKEYDDIIGDMNKFYKQWTMAAARMECSWICSSCCSTFEDGMPSECPHSSTNGCNEIIARDKVIAFFP